MIALTGILLHGQLGRHTDADLVNNMLEETLSTLEVGEHPIVHSIGFHYPLVGMDKLINKTGLTRSMSKRSSPDNSACEGFFGQLKN
ncbi:hypothetical protein MASR1M31_22300 [Porphyromonadaceae bacterium]